MKTLMIVVLFGIGCALVSIPLSGCTPVDIVLDPVAKAAPAEISLNSPGDPQKVSGLRAELTMADRISFQDRRAEPSNSGATEKAAAAHSGLSMADRIRFQDLVSEQASSTALANAGSQFGLSMADRISFQDRRAEPSNSGATDMASGAQAGLSMADRIRFQDRVSS